MAIYMKYGTIKGDATEADHKEWLTINSLQLGVGRGISTPSGSAANREATQPSISEITITKDMDISSIPFFKEALTSPKGTQVTIDFVATGEPNRVYATYTLENALISGYSVSSGGDRPSESLSINFTKVEFKYTSYDESNGTAKPMIQSYDLATAKPS